MTMVDLGVRLLLATAAVSLIAIAVLVLRPMLRPHAARYGFECTALLCMLATVGVLVLIPTSDALAPTGAVPAEISGADAGDRSLDTVVSGARRERARAATTVVAVVNPGATRLLRGSGWVCAGGSIVLIGVILFRLVLLHARRGARVAEPGDLARLRALAGPSDVLARVVFREGRAGSMPASSYLLRPTVHLPLSWRDEHDDRLRDLLNHEIVHLARRDPWILLLQHALLAAGWTSPVVWMFHRRMCDDRELSCDEQVVRRTGARRSYALTLLRFGARSGRRAPLISTGIAGRGGAQLTRRIHMLSNQTGVRSRFATQLRLAGVVVIASCATALAASSFVPAPLGAAIDREAMEIVVAAPVIEGDGWWGGHGLRGTSGSTNETVVCMTGDVQIGDNGRNQAASVSVNLPENSGLDAVLRGAEINFAPGETSLFVLIDGSLTVREPGGVVRLVISPVVDGGTLHLASDVQNSEFCFQISAVDADGVESAIEVRSELPGEGVQSLTNESLSWYVDEREDEGQPLHRIRLTRQYN